jgi:hypothetical protein
MNLQQRYQESDRVFIGRINGIDPPPTAASGAVAVLRGVTYDVIGTLKGPSRGTTVKVAHYVVSETRDMQRSDTQDPGTPFRRSAVHMVFAVNGEDMFDNDRARLEELDNEDGLLELSNPLVSGLKRALGPRRTLFGILRWLFFGR